jgi:hypothetical protein
MVRAFIQHNGFYLLSVILFLVGCKLLMKSPLMRQTEFARVLYTFAILQGYEALVLASAAWIARRLRILGDGFLLLAIAGTLMLDPTFFSNNFLTIFAMQSTNSALPTPTVLRAGGVVVCALAFLLLPGKLLLIERIARIRLQTSARLGLMLGGAFIFLAAFPMNFEAWGPAERLEYYFALAWCLPLVALAFPPRAALLIPTPAPAADFHTSAQLTGLRVLLLAVPLLLTIGHWFEHAYIYEFPLRPFLFAPLCITLLAFFFAQQRRRFSLYWIDACFVAAILLTLAPYRDLVVLHTLQDKTLEYRNEMALQAIHASHLPWLLLGLAISAAYALHWFWSPGRAVLYRMAAFACVLLSIAGWRSGLVPAWLLAVRSGAVGAAGWLGAHPAACWWFIWGLGVCGLLRWRTLNYRIFMAFFSVPMAFSLLPGGFRTWAPVEFECFFALVLLGSHLRRPHERGRAAVAFIIALIAYTHCANASAHTGLLLAICAAWAVVGVLLGYRLHQWGYVIIGGLLALSLLPQCLSRLPFRVSPQVLCIAGALLIFSCGLLVTFNKTRILNCLAPATSAPPDAPAN